MNGAVAAGALALGAIVVDGVPISADSAIGVGLVVVVLGAAWRLSGQLARIDTKLDNLSALPEKVAGIENRLGKVEIRVQHVEQDLNNLWAAQRGQPPEQGRKPGRHGGET